MSITNAVKFSNNFQDVSCRCPIMKPTEILLRNLWTKRIYAHFKGLVTCKAPGYKKVL